MANFFSVACALLLALLAVSVPCESSATPPERKAEGAAAATLNTPGPKVVKLERQSVILPKTAVRAGRSKNFYSAKLAVGKPGQEFHVSIDLGGGTMVLPSQTCKDSACLERRRYDKWISGTAEDIQANGQLVQPTVRKTMLRRRDRGTLVLHSIDVGNGKVKGTFVRDQVCVRGDGDDIEGSQPRCFPLAMLIASEMSDMPFEMEPYDGTVGLGLKGMSVSAEFNFLAGFNGFTQYGDLHPFPNSFGLHLGGDEDGGEITFGGYDVKRLTNPLQWAKVAEPEEGRWQVAIAAIRVGNKTLEACRNGACRAAIDYSSSLLGVPTALASGLETTLATLAVPNGFGDGCQHLSLPDLHLELTDGISLSVPAEDFVSEFGSKRTLSSKTSCQPLLAHNDGDEDVPLGQDVFILGEATLRRYYTFFNADSLQMGFSLAAGSSTNSVSSVPALPGGSSKDAKGRAAKDKEPVILLVQVKLLRSKTVSSLSQ
jgi:hypothetical protein